MTLKEFLHNKKIQYQGSKIAPIFNALHTFLFVPNETTFSGSHIRDAADLKRIMSIVIISMFPCLLFGIWNVGYQYFIQTTKVISFYETFIFGLVRVFPIVAVTYIVGLTVEFLFAMFRGHEVNEGFLVTGLLVPLIVPIELPLWILAIAVIFGIVIGKEVFGGTGMNILNPALTIRAFIFFSYPAWISGDKVWVSLAKDIDAISGETILSSLSMNQGLLEGKIYVGERCFSVLDLIVGTIPGSIGETSIIAIGLGALILIVSGVGSYKIIVSMILGGSIMAYICNCFAINDLMRLPWYQHLLIGGFAFGAVFMATDPVSASQTELGKWIYGFLIGILSILIRVFNPAFPEGVMMAILLMNVFAPLIDYYVISININQRMRRLNNIKL